MKSPVNKWLINYFENQDVYIVGSGPSLLGFDFKKLENKNVIAVNNSYKYVKHNILIFYDPSFQQTVRNNKDDIYKMDCKIITGRSSGIIPKNNNISIVNMKDYPSKNPDYLYGSFQSGLMAINAALISEAKKIFLLGFDCTWKNNICHFYYQDCNHPESFNKIRYERAVPYYDKFCDFRNKIFNCSDISLIKTFQKIKLEDLEV